jgi:ankyrin repeat protein
LLLKYRADINAKNDSGQTAIDVAAGRGNRSTADVLLENGETLDIGLAAGLGMWDVVRDLLEADPAAMNFTRCGGTPLHWAARSGQVHVARVLLARGADIEARNDRSKTPLYVAALAGGEAVVKLLLAAGANANTTDRFRCTIIDSIQRSKLSFPGIVNLLRQYGASGRDPP